MTKPITAVWPGRPYPRGAFWDGEGVNFAIFSEHAEKVELCLFDAKGKNEVQRIELKERSDLVWHCYLPEAPSRATLWFPGAWTLPSGRGASFQSAQAADRTLCKRYSGNAALERRPFRLQHRQQARRSFF